MLFQKVFFINAYMLIFFFKRFFELTGKTHHFYQKNKKPFSVIYFLGGTFFHEYNNKKLPLCATLKYEYQVAGGTFLLS